MPHARLGDDNRIQEVTVVHHELGVAFWVAFTLIERLAWEIASFVAPTHLGGRPQHADIPDKSTL
jgi:hypothetical protein